MSIKICKNENPSQLDMQMANYVRNGNTPKYIPIYFTDEIWKLIEIDELQPWYFVSSYGRVYSKLFDGLIRQRFVGRGYKTVTLRKRDNFPIDYLVHRLVMMAFNPVSGMDNLQINHIDTDKTNNHISNLEWCTQSENIIHAYKHGLFNQGEDNNFSFISNSTAIQICEALEQGKSIREICNLVGLDYYKHRGLVKCIKNRKTWKNISKNYNF